jgi:CubicO group peptidase (beta-lactamase class C family)
MIGVIVGEQYTRERIIAPLGMANSGIGRSGFVGHANASKPYNADGSLLGYPLEKGEGVGPAGAIYSTAPDMLKYLELYLRLRAGDA